jgi:hypothetical protein
MGAPTSRLVGLVFQQAWLLAALACAFAVGLGTLIHRLSAPRGDRARAAAGGTDRGVRVATLASALGGGPRDARRRRQVLEG